MKILEICSMMLLLDCSNPIVVHFMALKNGALSRQIINAFVYHGTKVFETLKKIPYTTHPWILGPLLGRNHIHCQLQQRTLRFLCSIQNNNNTLGFACWKYANNNANSPLGYNIAYFRNSYGIDISPDLCVRKLFTLHD